MKQINQKIDEKESFRNISDDFKNDPDNSFITVKNYVKVSDIWFGDGFQSVSFKNRNNIGI